MKQFTLLTFFLIALSISLNAQNAPSLSSSEIIQSFKKLNTLGSVLYIAAHPDDENTRLLAYLSREKNLRTGYLSLTRGDGGQNLVGKEQGDALGLIRTQELLAARRIDGAEQFFTRANDFGFSKNPEETFSIWNKDSVLADVVWCIRRFKPDVIICRFPTTGEGGHGHHTASAILAVEAFDAAADPKRFPEQLKFTETWQAKRIFWNTFNFGTTNTTSPDQLKIDVGVFNPLVGKGYGEIAAESRSMHKSQGFGSAKGRGASLEYFKQLKGEPVKDNLFEGIDQSWQRLAAATRFHSLIDECFKAFDSQQPDKSIPALVSIYKQLLSLDEKEADMRYWKQQKLKETENLLLACAGLWLEATAADYIGIPGNKVELTAQVIARNNSPVKLNKISWMGQSDTTTTLSLKPNELYSFKHKENLPATAAFSNPYWLKEQHSAGLYTVRDQKLVGQPENAPYAKVVFDLDIAGLYLQCERGLTYKYTDPVKGEIYRPFEILPPATVNLSEKVYIFDGTASKKVQFTIKANTPNLNGTLSVKVPDGWKVTISNPEIKLNNKGEEISIDATVTPGKLSGKITASLNINGNSYSKSITRIEYDHIPYQFILNEAEAGLVNLNIQKTGTAIGYIAGAGDDVPACLKQLGYTVTMLTDELISNSDLSKYTAIVTGVRAYNTNDRLQLHHNKLMNYVNNGGNLIVQYNTNSRVGPLQAKIGPYPFTISRDRVTDETAEVRLINPTHSVLNFPNKISNSDFDGWKQERGIYFAIELDKNYETVLSINDPTEKPHEGSLIISKYGKGNFVYTGLAFFRELPAGVPGAYRLFVNLLSIPAQK
ncbi:MAG: PIG-L family deacetylase [Bacteroidota bacterium]